MRIIGGKYKGRIFNPGKKFKARPTTDLAKEGLFNILENRYNFEEFKVLDLFSGTGNMGYEFASRGACEVVMVEKNFSHFRFIREILQQLAIPQAQIIKADAFQFLNKNREKFNIVFADPPFDLFRLAQVPDAVLNAKTLNTNGILILEHPKEFNFSDHPNFTELRKYGKVHFSFFA